MSAHTANSQYSFQLPSLSYIDAKWEEPNLRDGSGAIPARTRSGGLAAWLSRKINAFTAWRRDSQAAAELSGMSDRELMDIGISRADLGRVFNAGCNEDLQRRG